MWFGWFDRFSKKRNPKSLTSRHLTTTADRHFTTSPWLPRIKLSSHFMNFFFPPALSLFHITRQVLIFLFHRTLIRTHWNKPIIWNPFSLKFFPLIERSLSLIPLSSLPLTTSLMLFLTFLLFWYREGRLCTMLHFTQIYPLWISS